MIARFVELLDFESLVSSLLAYLPNAIVAVAFLVGSWLLSRLTRPALKVALKRADFAPTLSRLLVDNLYHYALLGLGVIMAAGQLGIDVTAALAGFGVAGIAVGFAAQDSLANVIAGFLIFWDKPFKVGDYISVQDNYGQVKNITLRTTRIRTQENTYVIIPNKEIIDDVLENHSMFGATRINVPVGIAYKEDVRRAREILLKAVAEVEGTTDDPEADVVVTQLGASSVDLSVRVWVEEPAGERPVFFRTLEACKNALDDANVEIPFPHLQLFVEDIKPPVWERARELPKLAASDH